MRNLLLHVLDSPVALRRTQREGGNHHLPEGSSSTSNSTPGPEPTSQIVALPPGKHPKPPLGPLVPLLAVIAVTFLCLIYPTFSSDVATAIALISAAASLATKRNKPRSDGEEEQTGNQPGQQAHCDIALKSVLGSAMKSVLTAKVHARPTSKGDDHHRRDVELAENSEDVID